MPSLLPLIQKDWMPPMLSDSTLMQLEDFEVRLTRPGHCVVTCFWVRYLAHMKRGRPVVRTHPTAADLANQVWIRAMPERVTCYKAAGEGSA